MEAFTSRAADKIRSFPGDYQVLGPAGSSVCEVHVPFGATPAETTERVAQELRRLQSTLAPLVDEVIAECQQ